MFAEGKSFPHSAGYTIGNSAQFFPHVENPVENVQKSSVSGLRKGGRQAEAKARKMYAVLSEFGENLAV